MKDIFTKKLFFHQPNQWFKIIPVCVLNPVGHGLLAEVKSHNLPQFFLSL